MAIEFVGASRGFLILLEPGGSSRYCLGREAHGQAAVRRPPQGVLEVMSQVRETGQAATHTGEGPPSVCVPLVADGQVSGVLYLDRTDGDPSFQPREERLAELSAGQLAMSLTARVLYEQMPEKRKQVELIDRVSRAVAAPGDLDSVLREVAESAREALAAEGVTLLLADAEGMLQCRHRHGMPADLLASPGAALARRVLSEGVRGTHGDGTWWAAAVPVRQVLRERHPLHERRRQAYSVPFARVLGVLYLENREHLREFGEDDQMVLQVFADHVTNAVSNDLLYQQASTDSLTGLASRRYLDLRLVDEVEFARLNDCPLSLVMLDIDDFKQLNDAHGHQAGDEVLRRIGSILRGSVRQGDVCGRYGGEEFLLGLPETDLQGAQVVAENVRRRIADSRFVDEDHPVPVTVSLGVAAFPARAGDLPSLIEAADRALYSAKRSGKNRHVVAGETEQQENG
jgi:diguanylate cyclase (GGDEF)-like protein